jgi:hypothetical protein
LSRRRRWLAWALLSIVPVLVVLLDVRRRGARIAQFEQFHALTYLGSFVESLCVWGALLYAASRRRGALRHVAAALFVIMVTFTVGGQSYFYDQYHAYLNVDVSVFASSTSCWRTFATT